MEPNRIRGGASWGVQGCLVGAVTLFVVLMLAILFILYQQLRSPPEPTAELGFSRQAASAPAIYLPPSPVGVSAG